MRYCTNCGKGNNDNAVFCHSCGTKLAPARPAPAAPSPAPKAQKSANKLKIVIPLVIAALAVIAAAVILLTGNQHSTGPMPSPDEMPPLLQNAFVPGAKEDHEPRPEPEAEQESEAEPELTPAPTPAPALPPDTAIVRLARKAEKTGLYRALQRALELARTLRPGSRA